MNYYYDIILNWNEEEAYNFYEWNDTDCFELVKKIPFFKVKHKTLVDLLTYKIEVDKDFLALIKDKTVVSGKNVINRITYACLITDNKSVIALEFNEEGLSINKSKLLVDDELNALEVTFSLKEYFLDYRIIDKVKTHQTLRQEQEAKKLINLEINSLYQRKDLAKMRYLYYEYKKEQENDLETIYHNLMDDLKNNFNPEILKLYYIIKLSYHNV